MQSSFQPAKLAVGSLKCEAVLSYLFVKIKNRFLKITESIVHPINWIISSEMMTNEDLSKENWQSSTKEHNGAPFPMLFLNMTSWKWTRAANIDNVTYQVKAVPVTQSQ